MRRASTVLALATSALMLTGCSGDDAPSPPTTPAAEGELTGSDADAATGGADASTSTTQGPATATGEEAPSTQAPTGEAEGGEEGQAAAAVAKKFFSAMVTADPKACDYLLSFTDVEVPMTEVSSDYETCQTLLPPILEQEVKAQGLDAEGTAILEAMTITGADVKSDGTTAVVDKDNFSPLFAESMGEEVITLKKLGDSWYIDLDHSFTPTSGE